MPRAPRTDGCNGRGLRAALAIFEIFKSYAARGVGEQCRGKENADASANAGEILDFRRLDDIVAVALRVLDVAKVEVAFDAITNRSI